MAAEAILSWKRISVPRLMWCVRWELSSELERQTEPEEKDYTRRLAKPVASRSC